MSTSREIASFVVDRWFNAANQWASYFSVPVEKVLAHIAVESKGREYALHSDKFGESYYAKSADDAFLKLSEWERRGDSALNVSIGLMQVVPKNGLADYNRVYGASAFINPDELVSDPAKNIQAGTGYLRVLFQRWGDWGTASRAYNGNPKLERTANYLKKILEYEQIIKQLIKS